MRRHESLDTTSDSSMSVDQHDQSRRIESIIHSIYISLSSPRLVIRSNLAVAVAPALIEAKHLDRLCDPFLLPSALVTLPGVLFVCFE
jgi:hypothetical protein